MAPKSVSDRPSPAPVKTHAFVWPEISMQGGRFIIVGIVATVTHFLTVVCLMDGLGLGIASIANAVAVLAGSSVSYLGNYFWTFRCGGRHLIRAGKFAIAYGTIFLFNGLAMLLVADVAGVPYLLPLSVIVAITPVLTFLLNRLWVFA